MKNYGKEIEILLKKLPYKLQVKYALYCAESVFHLVKDEDKPGVRKSLDTTALWLVDKASTDEVYASALSQTVTASAYSSAISAAYAADAAVSAYSSASAASSASYAYSYAYLSAYCSASTKDKNNASKHYYKELIRMIKDLTELDKLIYDLTDKEFL